MQEQVRSVLAGRHFPDLAADFRPTATADAMTAAARPQCLSVLLKQV